MEKPGMTVSRWIDGVLEKNDLIDQENNLRAIVFWGHAPNTQTRGFEMDEAMEKVDLMVIIDPYPSASAAMAAIAQDGVYLLPAAHAVRDLGFGDGVEPFDPVARKGHQPAVRIDARPRDHAGVRRRSSASTRRC